MNFGYARVLPDEQGTDTVQRWAAGEMNVEQDCALTGTARSSWYKYTKELGYTRERKLSHSGLE